MYPSPSNFHDKLRIDAESEAANPGFVDLRKLDLRVLEPSDAVRLSYSRERLNHVSMLNAPKQFRNPIFTPPRRPISWVNALSGDHESR